MQRKHLGTKAQMTRLACLGLVIFFVPFLFVASVQSRSDGRFISFNDGVLSTMPCFASNCHNATGGTFNMGGSVSFNNLPQSFVPGQSYDIGVTITEGVVYGLQVATIYSDNTQAGFLTPLTSGVIPNTDNGIHFLVHSPVALNNGTVNFRWTAPISPKENTVIFKVASNSANNDFSRVFDKINTAQATIPQQEGPALTEKLYFAQFADGTAGSTQIFSQVTLMNLSSTTAVNGKIEILDDNGNPITVDLNEEVVAGEKSFSIAAGGSAIFTTDRLGPIQAGSATVSSDGPLAGVILFAGSVGVAGVGSSQPLTSFIAPMDMDVQNGILTGIAVMNLESTAQTLQTELIDLNGNVVTTGTFGLQPLAGQGHLARFLNESDFQFQDSPDLSNFRGLLKVTASSGQIAATVIRQSPGEFAALPVAQRQ
ncbi:hypothetical protein MYX84_13095 [Acidobacteria bacterium AH-259-O06]|nr:hypothetical protein [Acidobacteria bacterium AH-259-O06]